MFTPNLLGTKNVVVVVFHKRALHPWAPGIVAISSESSLFTASHELCHQPCPTVTGAFAQHTHSNKNEERQQKEQLTNRTGSFQIFRHTTISSNLVKPDFTSSSQESSLKFHLHPLHFKRVCPHVSQTACSRRSDQTIGGGTAHLQAAASLA